MEIPMARSTTKPTSVRNCALRFFPWGGEGGSHCEGEGPYPGTPVSVTVSVTTGRPISLWPSRGGHRNTHHRRTCPHHRPPYALRIADSATTAFPRLTPRPRPPKAEATSPNSARWHPGTRRRANVRHCGGVTQGEADVADGGIGRGDGRAREKVRSLSASRPAPERGAMARSAEGGKGPENCSVTSGVVDEKDRVSGAQRRDQGQYTPMTRTLRSPFPPRRTPSPML
jgi:hypothetical protein